MDNPVVYGADRVRRLRVALGAAVGLGVVTGVIALLVATNADEDGANQAAVILGIVSVGSILCGVVSWRMLGNPTATAKRAVIISGALLLVFALPTFPFAVGLLYVVLGMVVIFLAVIAEEDDPA